MGLLGTCAEDAVCAQKEAKRRKKPSLSSLASVLGKVFHRLLKSNVKSELLVVD